MTIEHGLLCFSVIFNSIAIIGMVNICMGIRKDIREINCSTMDIKFKIRMLEYETGIQRMAEDTEMGQ